VTTLPYFISWIILFGLAFAMFSSDGVLNSLLTLLRAKPIPSPGILGNSGFAWTFQWALSIWKYLGWNAIIYLAAIAGIDSELYDAAKADGANRFQIIVYVTIPGLVSTYLVLLLLSISNMLSNGFDQYFVFMNPMVSDKLEVLDFYVYKIGLLTNNYPYSTAIGMTKTLISVALLFTANTVSKRIRGGSII
jgi:ABC-type polysaccharide transport system permease subunit